MGAVIAIELAGASSGRQSRARGLMPPVRLRSVSVAWCIMNRTARECM